DTLDLGQGHVLEFIPTPTPRFPDQLCTYDPQTQLLLTDKLFGCHVCGDQVLDEGGSIYQEDRRYYFDCVLAPSAKQVSVALDRLAGYPAQLYVPSHGPLVKYSLSALTLQYQQWLSQQKSQSLTVALVYASAYGNTTTLAQAIARGITKAGVAVEAINA
ncbi:MAG: flavin oxidoreductase, partial [Microcystaceae cyanobacterium]